MTTKTASTDICHLPACKKPWLSHHTFNRFTAEGKPVFDCHVEARETPDPVVAYVIGLRTEKLKALGQVKDLERKREADMQAVKADLEREFAAKVKSEAAKVSAADVERTRVELNAAHNAKLLDTEAQLTQVRATNVSLNEANASLTAELEECKKKAFDLGLANGELEEELATERRLHEQLKRESKEVLRLGFALSKHVLTLGHTLGVKDEADIEEIGAARKDIVPPAPAPVTEIKAAAKPVAVTVPPPAPIPAPQPTVAAARTAVPAPPPVPATAEVVLDDSLDESDDSASADDEDSDIEAEADGAIGDDDVIDELDADSEEEGGSPSDEDDAPAEEVEVEECRGCDKPATHAITFKNRDGSTERLSSCNPKKHAEDFLRHLRTAAVADVGCDLKVMPQKPGQLVTLLKSHPINPATNS